MSTGNLLEMTIIGFIVIGMGITMWRGGAQNPVGTGGLDRRLRVIGRKVAEIEGRVEAIESAAATKEDIDRLEKLLVGRVSEFGARLPDIESRQRALSDQLSEHQKQSAGTASTVSHILRQVDLIYGVLVKKGMDK